MRMREPVLVIRRGVPICIWEDMRGVIHLRWLSRPDGQDWDGDAWHPLL